MAELTMFKRFTNWARDNGYPVAHDYGQFIDQDTQRAWVIWQADDKAAQTAYGVKALDPTKPQHCRLGAPVPGFPTQECNCAPVACRLGKDDPADGEQASQTDHAKDTK